MSVRIVVTMSLYPEQLHALERMEGETGMTRSEIVRAAIDLLDKQGREVKSDGNN